jgi:hypothetical protein
LRGITQRRSGDRWRTLTAMRNAILLLVGLFVAMVVYMVLFMASAPQM